MHTIRQLPAPDTPRYLALHHTVCFLYPSTPCSTLTHALLCSHAPNPAQVLATIAHRFLAVKMHWSPALSLGLGLGDPPGRPLMQTHCHSHPHCHSHTHTHAHPHDGAGSATSDSGAGHRLVSPEASPSKWARGPQPAAGHHHSGHQPPHGPHGHGHGHGQAALPLWARLLLLLPLPRVGLPAMAAASVVCVLASAAAMGATCRL